MTKLFAEFDPISTKAWKQKIQVDLKGADYNDTLIWNSPEGISVKPFYNQNDLKTDIAPATRASQWKIVQEIFVGDENDANQNAKVLLTKGVEALRFIIPSHTISLKGLLEGLESTPCILKFNFLNEAMIAQIKEIDQHNALYLDVDILGRLAQEGNWFHNLKKDHDILDKLLSTSSQVNTQIAINISLYQNAGANMIQQLAYALAQSNEYFNHYEHKLSKKVCYKVAVGSNYFFEIAKLRALRLLHATLANEYKLNSECIIMAEPTKRNKTIYDYNTNMLRTTTECMSAILGGSDFISNLPYDAIYHRNNAFGDRISRNQLLILKHESYFKSVDNPAEGSYYIESLTNDMAQKALNLLKDIEVNGGFLSQLKQGTIQRKIKESAKIEQDNFNAGQTILLGTNKHPNPSDRMQEELELYPFVKTKKRKTLIEPIIQKRLAESIEKERLKKEKNA